MFNHTSLLGIFYTTEITGARKTFASACHQRTWLHVSGYDNAYILGIEANQSSSHYVLCLECSQDPWASFYFIPTVSRAGGIPTQLDSCSWLKSCDHFEVVPHAVFPPTVVYFGVCSSHLLLPCPNGLTPYMQDRARLFAWVRKL